MGSNDIFTSLKVSTANAFCEPILPRIVINCIWLKEWYVISLIDQLVTFTQVPLHHTGGSLKCRNNSAFCTRFCKETLIDVCPVGWGCKIHLLLLCRVVRPIPINECSGYDTKWSDGEVPVMLGPWGIWSIPSLPLHSGPLWLRNGSTW